jgi:hypothetical protein
MESVFKETRINLGDVHVGDVRQFRYYLREECSDVRIHKIVTGCPCGGIKAVFNVVMKAVECKYTVKPVKGKLTFPFKRSKIFSVITAANEKITLSFDMNIIR